MVIISQSEKDVINYDRVKAICLSPIDPLKIVAYFSCDFVNSEDQIKLAKYSTVERAKEVLRNIAYSKARELKVYEMPKE